MHFILPYFIIILVVIQLYLKKNSQNSQKKIQEFWEREQKSNLVRKKDISNLNYIKWDDSLPTKESSKALFDILSDSQEANAYYEAIMSTKDLKMINLTSYSNTDLKLKYGVANLQTLSDYESNYTKLIRNLSDLGHLLIEKEDKKDARAFLEYSVRIGSDIRLNYTDLYSLYEAENDTKAINKLKQYAQLLTSLNKDVIMKIFDS